MAIKGYVYQPDVARGSNSHAKVAAPHDQRYVGLFHWCGYWKHWDKVIAVDGSNWTVQAVEMDGTPSPGIEGRIRVHCTSMEACHFADRPFHPRTIYAKDAVMHRIGE